MHDVDDFVEIKPLTELYIDAESCKDVLEFFNHFQLEIPQGLTDAANAFIAETSVENQNAFRVELCAALSSGKEDIFNDETFQLIKNNAKMIVFENYFNLHLEEVVGEEK